MLEVRHVRSNFPAAWPLMTSASRQQPARSPAASDRTAPENRPRSSSHEFGTVERVASRVVILHRGRIVADDAIASLRTMMAPPTLEQIFAELAVELNPRAVSRELADVISG